MKDAYRADENQIFFRTPRGREELFLTIHPNTSDLTVEEQAVVLAKILNELPVVR